MKSTDGYPAGMTMCESVGISGNCGDRCPALWSGNCKESESFRDEIEPDRVLEFEELYGEEDA